MYRLCTLVLSLVVASTGFAANQSNRVALVIGNAAYKEAPLRNPANDARAVGQTLQRLGFQVTTLLNGDHDAMQAAIVDFAGKLDKDTTGLFYYAGHGVQSRGRNFLVPTDSKLQSERALRFETIEVNVILEEMAFANNRVNIVILDACRNNPFERRFRGATRGLAAIDAARGTLIAYATSPGSVAADGDGRNGLYTSALLQTLSVPGLKAEEVFKRVRIAVTNETSGQQVPWESSSLTGDFVFNAVEQTVAARPPSESNREELLFWESIKDADRPEYYQAYLERYPNGTFAALARLNIDRLAGAASTTSSPKVSAPATSVATIIPQAPQPVSDPEPAANVSIATAQPPPQETSRRAVEKSTYTVAVFQPAYLYMWDSYPPGHLVYDLVSDVQASIQEMSGFWITYSDVGDYLASTGATPDDIWTGGQAHKTPNLEAIYRAGEKLGVDGVVTWWGNPVFNTYQWRLEIYLIDVQGRRVYKHKGKNTDARKFLDRALSEFKKNRSG